MTIKIENNVPIAGKTRKSKYPLGDLKIKQSFFIKAVSDKLAKAKAAAIRGSITNYVYNNPKTQFTVRRVDGGIRVWRIK